MSRTVHFGGETPGTTWGSHKPTFSSRFSCPNSRRLGTLLRNILPNNVRAVVLGPAAGQWGGRVTLATGAGQQGSSARRGVAGWGERDRTTQRHNTTTTTTTEGPHGTAVPEPPLPLPSLLQLQSRVVSDRERQALSKNCQCPWPSVSKYEPLVNPASAAGPCTHCQLAPGDESAPAPVRTPVQGSITESLPVSARPQEHPVLY